MQDDFLTAAALISKGARVDAEYRSGNTALMWAGFCEEVDPKLVALLLQKGADPDHKSKMGETALTWAQRRGDTE